MLAKRLKARSRARAESTAGREQEPESAIKKTRTDDMDEVMTLINSARALTGNLPIGSPEIHNLEPVVDHLFVKGVMPSQVSDIASHPGIVLNTSSRNLGSKERQEQLELWRSLHEPIVIIGTSSCPAAPKGGHEPVVIIGTSSWPRST